MPDLPIAPRIPWNLTEIGGTVIAYKADGTGLTEATQTQKDNLAAEDNTDWQPPSAARDGWVALLLPTFDLAGFVGIRADMLNNRTAQYSTNTVDGIDGSWTDIPDYVTPSADAKPGYREGITIPLTVVNDVKAVRYGTTTTFAARNNYRLLHVYGYLQGDDRLELWHPTVDERLPGDHFDLGDYVRGGAAVDVDFRVKNRSATKTANSISLERYVNTDTGSGPTVESWHELSYDGGAFGAGPLSIGNLAAGAISDVCTLRRQPPSDAALGFWTGHLFADADSWS